MQDGWTLFQLWKVFQKVCCILAKKISAYDASFFFSLAASYSFLPYVHQVTVHAGSPCKRSHNPICVPIFALLVSERLSVKNLAVLQGNFAVTVGAHFIRQFGHSEKILKHLVNVGVLLCWDFKVSAELISTNQLLDLVLLHLTIKVPVTLVAADDQRDVRVLFGFVSQTGLCLIYLAFQALHLLERVSVVQAKH